MFDLEQAIANWKQRLQREQGLSLARVEELEDHLRASVEGLCDGGASEGEAFAVATRRIGGPGEIGAEFRKLRPRGWRLLLGAGWACYAASFLLPVHREGATLLDGKLPGWEAIHGAVVYGGAFGKLSALTNVVMLLTLLALPKAARLAPRVLLVAGVASALLNGWWMQDGVGDLRSGYFLWCASFAIVSLGLLVRTGGWELLRQRLGGRARPAASA